VGVRRWLVWLPFAAFAGMLWVATERLLPAERVVQFKPIDTPLPHFTLPPLLPGKPGLSSADFGRGEPRLINVFASWCVPCIAESPQLMALKRAGIRIEGVAIRDRPDAVRRFLARNGDPYGGIGDDRTGRVQLALGSSGVPETYLVDGRGRIVRRHAGDIRADDVPAILAAVQTAR
jgi:cytochrome c biogenesis protein CcmG/thiol:disulfide interchange protein DsbE